MKIKAFLPVWIIGGMLVAPSFAQELRPYPATRAMDVTDDYHGVKVADPYRWLEDDRSAETAAWIKAQNEVSYAYLDAIPFKEKIYKDLQKVNDYPKYLSPRKKGDYVYFYQNDGLQNQPVLYRQKGAGGPVEMVMDVNKLSADGTTKLVAFNLSKSGRYAVMGFSKGGSDWQQYQVMDMQTLTFLTDRLDWIKLSTIGWQGKGFYYSRYPKPEGSELAARNENHQVFYHRLGTPQDSDQLVFSDPANPERFHNAVTSEDEKLVLLIVKDRGKGKDGNGLWIRSFPNRNFEPVKGEISAFKYNYVALANGRLFLETNEHAPNGKVMCYDLKSRRWTDLIPEKREPLQSVSAAGGKLFALYSQDVSTRAYVYNLRGELENEVKVPILGTATGFAGEAGDGFVFFNFTSLNYPPTIFRYDIRTKQTSVFRRPEVSFNPDDYEVKQVFVKSKDGTKIPASVIYKKGLKMDGSAPALMYAYGGFGVSWTPTFSPTRIAFLDQGGVYMQPNLRGGGEYGEEWHRGGMRLHKQNVFDDFIACAEYLIREKYTSSARLAIQGGSNGGLLLAAVMNQRPELFRVAFPSIGLLDMLRYHKFTIGWSWIPEFGSSDNAEEFKALYAYSPLHNVPAGKALPAMLITTADHDDRVVPAHSYKYAATVQARTVHSPDRPVLLRVDVNSGHGASNAKKSLETSAYMYAFMFRMMGLEWK